MPGFRRTAAKKIRMSNIRIVLTSKNQTEVTIMMKGEIEMLNFNTKWNYANTYMVQPYLFNHLLEVPALHYMEGEMVKEMKQPFNKKSEKEMMNLFDKTDQEIIFRVAMSKYLLIDQIHQYLWLSGIRISSGDICRRLRKLIMTRTIKQVEIVDSQTECKKLDCYKLDYWGGRFVFYRGMYLHKGIKYLPYKSAKVQGKLDTSADIKRILAANQILLNLLKDKVDMGCFGFMETLRPQTEDYDFYEKGIAPLVRPQLSVVLHQSEVLTENMASPLLFCYEIVRNQPDAMDKLVEKMGRFAALDDNENYPSKNYHSYAKEACLVLCGESESHNRVIYEFLQKSGFFQSNNKIFFTDDKLIRKGITAVYEIKEDGVILWHELRTNEAAEHYAA